MLMKTSSMPNRAASHSVLVVDSDPGVLILLGRLLDLHQIRALYARSASEAVSIAARPYVDIGLVLTNVALPESSGPEAVSRVRGVRPGLPALYMMARTEDDVIRLNLMHRNAADSGPGGSPTLLDMIRGALSAGISPARCQ